MFRCLCGHKAVRNMFLTTTQWSSVNPADGEFRESRLRDEDLWGGLIGIGATVQRFHGTKESGLELIRKLIPHMPEPLEIQDQIVEPRVTLLETNAGKCTNKELIGLKEFKGELEFIRKGRQEAMEPWNRGGSCR